MAKKTRTHEQSPSGKEGQRTRGRVFGLADPLKAGRVQERVESPGPKRKRGKAATKK